MELSQVDTELIQAASDIVKKLYVPDRHVVGCAIRSKSGKVATAVNVDANVGRVGVCAEAIALGKMISEGDGELTDIVSVFHPSLGAEEQSPYVVSPYGVCREMLSDYAPDANITYVDNGQIMKSKVKELLPGKYTRKA